jgi:site-specific recombinase XerD
MIDIKNHDVQKSVDILVKKCCSETSIKGFLSSLRYTFNYGIKKDRIIIENPVHDIDIAYFLMLKAIKLIFL